MVTVDVDRVRIESGWKEKLRSEFQDVYFLKLKSFLIEERKQYVVYPPPSQIFAAFDLCPFEHTKVVILGQDPYHGPGQAHGLCFSVPRGIPFPPSLQNIFKELHDDLGIPMPKSGDLTPWAKQGVLLLNATLTVRANSPGSHQNKGWEIFTDRVIHILASQKRHLVFMLWGNYARAKKSLILPEHHLILEAAHPSPYSANKGFFGCKHFSRCNQYLVEHGIEPIDWRLLD